jgi:hypothetical protein
MSRLAPLALSSLLWAPACADDAAPVAHVSLSERMPTVVVVRWTTDVPATGWVEYGPTAELGQSSPASTEATTEHRAVLMGLAPDEDVYLQVVSSVDGVEERSDIESARTGTLSTAVPTPAAADGSAVDGWLLVPVLGGAWGPMMLDAAGQVVWCHLDESGLKVFRAVMAADGRGVLYNAVESTGGQESELVRVSLDGTQVVRTPVPGMTHDFVELEDGTVGTMVYDTRRFQGALYEGNALVEIDPDGTVRELWNTWDWFDPATTGGDDTLRTWSHANAIDYDPDTDRYLLGLRNFSAIFQIDRATGDMEWGVGQDGATLQVEEEEDAFLRQHQFDRVGDDGLLVFDNEGGAGGTSRVVEYRLDPAGGRATPVWQTGFEPPVSNAALGDVWRTEAGDTVAVVSMAGEIVRFDAAGQVVGRLNLGLGYALGYGTPLDSPYGRIAAAD